MNSCMVPAMRETRAVRKALRHTRSSVARGGVLFLRHNPSVPAGRGNKMAAAIALAGLRRRPGGVWGAGARRLLQATARQSQSQDKPETHHPHYPGIVESTEEYKFVERLIPPTRIPAPPKHAEYPTPSGWRAPSDTPPALPYFVRRSRMHNVPVYKDITSGNRRMTVIRKIEGDIWALEEEVKEFLTQLAGKPPPIQVNEITCSIRIKGYFDNELKEWLLNKGF